MQSFSFSLSKASLLYATLAHLSPQVQCFSNIVAYSPFHNESILFGVPPEILLIIRSLLIPAVSDQIRKDTDEALSKHESLLRSLVCDECVAYNEQIFGTNVWEWEQFTGPCACSEITKDGTRVKRAMTLDPKILELDPKEFPNQDAWIEAHLSAKAIRYSPSTPPSSFTPDTPIWSLAACVLNSLGCDVLIPNTPNTARERFIAIGSPWEAARRALLVHWDDCTHCCFVAPHFTVLDEWQAKNTVHRAREELGLDVSYEGCSSKAKEEDLKMIFTNIPRFKKPHIQANCLSFFGTCMGSGVLVQAIQAILALPLSLANTLAGVIYIYYQPGLRSSGHQLVTSF